MSAIERVNKIEAMRHLLRDYFQDIFELAETNPEVFGENADWAASDPKAFATYQTNSYRKILKSRKTDEVFKLYREHLADLQEN
jgi:hypothetical protein